MFDEPDDGKTNAERLREGLENHVMFVADKARAKYKEIKSLNILREVLNDNNIVRFPATLAFNAENIKEGELASLEKVSDDPETYSIAIHPHFDGRESAIISITLYMIVKINYGKIAKAYEAELFASSVMGINRDEYSTMMEGLKSEITK